MLGTTVPIPEVAAALPTNVGIRESHARELAPLRIDPDAMRRVWEAANQATDGKPTAAAIRAARDLAEWRCDVCGGVEGEEGDPENCTCGEPWAMINPMTDVAAISVMASGLVGLSGVVVGALSGRWERRNVLEAARVDRRQARMAEAYVELLIVAGHMGQWASLVHPVVDSTPPRPAPELASPESQASAFAKVDAYGSALVKARLLDWRATIDAIGKADLRIRLALEARREFNKGLDVPLEVRDHTTPWHELEVTLRPAELAARKALTDQVARDLAETPATRRLDRWRSRTDPSGGSAHVEHVPPGEASPPTPSSTATSTAPGTG